MASAMNISANDRANSAQDKNRVETGAGKDAGKGARAPAKVEVDSVLGAAEERLRTEYVVSIVDGEARRAAHADGLVATANKMITDAGAECEKAPYVVKVRESDTNATTGGPPASKAIGMAAWETFVNPADATMQNYYFVHASRFNAMAVGDNYTGAQAIMRLRPGVDVGAAVRATHAVLEFYNGTIDASERVSPLFAFSEKMIDYRRADAKYGECMGLWCLSHDVRDGTRATRQPRIG